MIAKDTNKLFCPEDSFYLVFIGAYIGANSFINKNYFLMIATLMCLGCLCLFLREVRNRFDDKTSANKRALRLTLFFSLFMFAVVIVSMFFGENIENSNLKSTGSNDLKNYIKVFTALYLFWPITVLPLYKFLSTNRRNE